MICWKWSRDHCHFKWVKRKGIYVTKVKTLLEHKVEASNVESNSTLKLMTQKACSCKIGRPSYFTQIWNFRKDFILWALHPKKCPIDYILIMKNIKHNHTWMYIFWFVGTDSNTTKGGNKYFLSLIDDFSRKV